MTSAPPANVVAERLGDAAVAHWLAYAQAHPGYAGMDALEAESAGIMGALTWAHDHERHGDLLALVHALNDFWFVRGRVDDARIGRPWALEAARALGDKSEQRFALHELAVLEAQAGRAEQARAGYEAALALARQLGDPAAQSTELQNMGALGVKTQQWGRAREALGEALALARQVQQPALIAKAVWWLAELDGKEDRRAEARAGFREALALYERLGNPDAAITGQRLRDLGCDE